ncbi:MAG: HAMP domain-containing histidine kinase [Tannerella sp.]|jgi:signal transduction histidine kinase|nr:HAMP domain-containing histidine kinase [Tannerella sp.]
MAKSIYDSRQRWTVIFILIALIIIVMTVVISNSFSSKLAQEERNKAEVWAEAMHIVTSDSEDSESQNLNLILSIINGNNSIPVILCDQNDSIEQHRNFNLSDKDTMQFLQNKIRELKVKNPPIIIHTSTYDQYLYYDESTVLKMLTLYPYIQLAVVTIFIVITFLALMSAKKAEQNKIWVGLSKETAHQLGTPISSLVAWVEYLKTKQVDASYLDEMEKDVKRLETIAERFSKIGSNPDLLPLNINDTIRTSYEYMSARVSQKVNINIEPADKPLLVLMNESLFSWVIENLTKNAVDAMEGQGMVTYRVEDRGRKVFIDVSDTGKGIQKSRFKTIFNPGYTTKKRGWGLGLSLVKRIVESYPGGKIYVNYSEIGKGTTFRIELRKYHG